MPDKSTADKLMIRSGRRVRVINPPTDLPALLGTVPDGAELLDASASAEDLLPADVILFFAGGRTDLETLLPGLRTALKPGGMIWVAYHKGTSWVKTDINRDSIFAYAQTIGLQGVAMVSINEDWAALRLKAA